MACSGKTYSYAQLEQLWINAGGPRSVAYIAAAIALAESTGCATSVNPNDSNGQGGTQTSWGLWQISNGTHSQPVPYILDPNVNARQAVVKYSEALNAGKPGFSPWGTYTSGAYKHYLNAATTPDKNGVPPPGVAAGSVGNEAQGISDSDCMFAFPQIASSGLVKAVSPVSNLLGSVGGSCILTKSQFRTVLGASILVAGGLVLTVGAVFIMVYGLGRSGGAAGQALQVFQSFPGGGKAAAATEGAGAAAGGAAEAAALA